MKTEEHEELRKLTAFQHWLGANYNTLPTDSGEMTKRAILYNNLTKEIIIKECYIVMVSSGEWEDEVEFNTGTVFLSLLSAEKELKKTEDYYTKETPFPFDWCDVKTFKQLIFEDKLPQEDLDKYDEWMDERYRKEEFNSCWIEKFKLEE